MGVHKIQGPGHPEAKRDRQQQGFSAQPLNTGPTDRKQRKLKRAKLVSVVELDHLIPAKEAKCCGKEGHYGSVCRSNTEKRSTCQCATNAAGSSFETSFNAKL